MLRTDSVTTLRSGAGARRRFAPGAMLGSYYLAGRPARAAPPEQEHQRTRARLRHLAPTATLLGAIGLLSAAELQTLPHLPVERWRLEAGPDDKVALSRQGQSLVLDCDVNVRDWHQVGHQSLKQASVKLLLKEPVALAAETARITLRTRVTGNPDHAAPSQIDATQPPVLGHLRVNWAEPADGVYRVSEPLAVRVRVFPKAQTGPLTLAWELRPSRYEAVIERGAVPVPAAGTYQDLTVTPKGEPGRDAYRFQLTLQRGTRHWTRPCTNSVTRRT